jgi:ureidoglycolate dehydrogenase (NAD+)
MSVYTADDLHQFAHRVFMAVNVPESDAGWVAETLVRADLQGLPSHGMSRLAAYVSAITRGKINPQPTIREVATGPVTTVVDGDNALGAVVAQAAMKAAMKQARRSGVGVVTAKRANHAGMLSIYADMASTKGLIGLALANAQPAIPPWGGRRAYFGTNPIAFSAPGVHTPVSIDMATSVVARGKIILAAKSGRAIPDGWAIDEQGTPTNNADAALRGAVLPMAGAKGYGLALAVEVLAGALSGASFGDQVGSIYDETPGSPGTGMFFLALDPAYFVGTTTFSQRMEEMAGDIHKNPVAEGFDEVLVPGERRRRTCEQRLQQGVPMSVETIQELAQLAGTFALDLPCSRKRTRETRV